MKSTWSGGNGYGWFTTIEVEINSRCNRKCPYCPVSVSPVPDVPQLMDAETLSALINKLARIGYGGRMAYNLYSEPLLHPNLTEIIGAVKRCLPAAKQVLYTNGDLLTDEIYEDLLDNGIARIILTSHDRRKIEERENQIVLFPEDLELTNRGGVVPCTEAMLKLEGPLDIPCYSPSRKLIITVTGDVTLCCEDALRSQVMGNIAQDNIEDIWFSERFEFTRQRLAQGNRDTIPVCALCNSMEFPIAEAYDPDWLPEV